MVEEEVAELLLLEATVLTEEEVLAAMAQLLQLAVLL
jgi:hypothetical protein